MQNPIVVLGTARTPLGGLQGDLSSLAAPQLGAAAIAAAVERSALRGRAVNEVIFGCVLSAGQGQARRVRRRSRRASASPRPPPPSTRCAARA